MADNTSSDSSPASNQSKTSQAPPSTARQTTTKRSQLVAAPPAAAGTGRTPGLSTKRTEPQRVYSPYSPASLQLFDVLRNDGFTERQVQSLAGDERVGPVYAKIVKHCEPFWTSKNSKKINKYLGFGACSARFMCPDEFFKWSQCRKLQERDDDPSDCLEFKEDADRCGVKMTQLMLRAALADDWY